MKRDPARRDPVRVAGWWLRWALVPALLGIFVSGNVDVRALPLVGDERVSAVLLRDGQAYFGHLDDSGESGTLLLRDVYYFQDAQDGPTGLAVALVKRGGEAHEPADGMRINRDQVLGVERVGNFSQVGLAIAVERLLRGAGVPFLSLNRPSLAGANSLAAQRVAVEHDLARGFAGAKKQLAKFDELVLPVTKAEADAIKSKALDDLRAVRRAGLVALAKLVGIGDADTYVRTTDVQLETGDFAKEPGVLLAPDLNAIVARAGALYTQVGDGAAQQLTRSQTSPLPSPSPSPSGTPAPSATPAPSGTPRPSATPTPKR